MVDAPGYASSEDVKRALGVKETAHNNGQVVRTIGSSSRNIDGLTHRRFYPQLATRKFDWPNFQYARPWRLWLERHELISITTLTAGGTTIPSTNFILRRADDLDEPPFNLLEIDLSTNSAFSAGDTHQQSIEILGLYGYRDDQEQIGTLTVALAADPNATATIDFSTGRIGTGDLLRIDSERMIIRRRNFVDSTQNLQGALAASKANDQVSVSTGTAFDPDLELLIGSEKMLITDVAGNTLVVQRAWDGSTLATHSVNDDIFVNTGVRLDRAQLGTTLASHNIGATVHRFLYPEPIRDLCVAKSLIALSQEGRAYARPSPSSRNRQNRDQRALMSDVGVGVIDLEREVRIRYRRWRDGAV